MAKQTVVESVPGRKGAESILRYLADNYEQVQRLRIQCGERIRAVLQGKDRTHAEVDEEGNPIQSGDKPPKVDKELKQIAMGRDPGPIPIIGRTYHRFYTEERDTYRDMMAAWKSHPAYQWLEDVKGMGPTLGCKLLARLDILKAPHASSFWAYCGLATVPGNNYRCFHCNLERGWPVGYKVKGTHIPLGAKSGTCPSMLELVAGPENGVRVAQPRPSKGEVARYDQYAKKVCYQIATSFVRQKGLYAEVYHGARKRLDVERPGWTDGRKHYTALRKVEKLFLSHLWQVWREAEGLPVSVPYAVQELGHDPSSILDPWDFIEPKKGKKAA